MTSTLEVVIIRKIFSTIFITGIPIGMLLMSYLQSPGYYMPAFSSPMGISTLVISGIWLAIGAFLMLATAGWRRMIVFVVFPVPVTLVVMLLPAVITIMTAMGPIMDSAK